MVALMKLRIKSILAGILFCCCQAVVTQASLSRQINAIVSSQKGVQFSIHIIEAGSGQTVYAYNARQPLMPASNMKVVTTAAALKYLGADFKYTTRLGMCGETLVVVGSGDPLFGDRKTDAKYDRKPDWIFEYIAAALKRSGIAKVTDIIVDTSVFDDQRVHPNWPKEELNRWYACEVCGLNFNGNCIEITADNKGGRVVLSVLQQTTYIEIISKLIPITSGTSTVGAYREDRPNKITIKGKCKGTVGPFDVAVERPAGFFGYMLAEHLTKAGIEVKGQLSEKPRPVNCDFRLLAEFTTPISDCLERANKDSLGLAAESLVKTIAASNNPGTKNGSWERGRELISQYLLKIGVKSDQFYIDDGSGLSRKNRLTAEAITKVLLEIYRSPYWELFRNSLAVGGVDGTLSRYFKEQNYKYKILGKTGYVNTAKSFSGICITDKGDYLFSILANNTNGQTREAINDIAKAIIDNL